MKLIVEKHRELDQKLKKYSNGIVGLQDNWDHQDSKGYNEKTWQRVVKLLEKTLNTLWDEKLEIPIPLILPASNGSFDINWETEQFELLVNIPSDIKELVNVYGEKIGFPEDEIEVRINYNLVYLVLIEWLKTIS